MSVSPPPSVMTVGLPPVRPAYGSTVAPLDKVQRSPGDPMRLGAERTAAFIRQVLAAGSYVVCHDTLTYGQKAASCIRWCATNVGGGDR
jgi:hypothetical protein